VVGVAEELQSRPAFGMVAAGFWLARCIAMNGSLVQLIVLGVIVAIPVLIVASSRRKADTQRRIAEALEEIAKKDRSE